MSHLFANPDSMDVVLKVGILAILILLVVFLGVVIAFLLMQQRRLQLLEENLQRLAAPKPEAESEGNREPADTDANAGPQETKGLEQAKSGDVASSNVPGRDEKSELAVPQASATAAKGKPATQAVSTGSAELEGVGSGGQMAAAGAGTKESPAGESKSEGKVAPSRSKPSIQTREGLRDRLASAETLLGNLESEERPLELNRKLAYLQAEVSAMQGTDVLDVPAEGLGDLLRFQGRLKEFIEERHESGWAQPDPSAFAFSEVKRLEKVVNDIAACVAENLAVGRVPAGTADDGEAIPGIDFKEDGSVGQAESGKSEIGLNPDIGRVEGVIREIEDFVGEQMRIGRDLVTGEAQGLTRQRLEETLGKADDAFANLVERQHQLAAGFLNHDLTLVDGQVDISPDLVGFCRHRSPNSTLLQPQRPALCQFANGEGVYHAEVVTHLDIVRANCRGLIEQHEEQEEILSEARSLTEQGRMDEAEKMLEKINPAFEDLASAEIRKRIESWRKQLGDLEERFALLKKLLQTPWERPFAQPWKVIRREEELLAHARDFEDRLEAFRMELSESENEEFVTEGGQLYSRLADQLNDLANTFTEQSNDAKISTFLHFALIAESVAGWMFAHPESRPVIVWTLGMLGMAFVCQRFHRWLLERTTVEFDLESNGKRLEERDLAHIFLNNKRYSSGDRIATGRYQLTLDGSIFEPVTQRVRIRFGRRNRIGSIPVRLCRDTYVNSLEMKFVPVAGTTVMFGVWLTRVRDFRWYAKEKALRWKRPRFKQDELHPAVNVSWEDARAFCQWLTDRERNMGRIGHRDEYRLPTDSEWSAACELGKEPGETPESRSGRVRDHYPWGRKWPPSRDSGNLDPSLNSDPYDFTSKVGMFPPNRHGLYDLAGNVWEWCDDLYEGRGKNRTLRGGSWHTASQEMLLSSFRLGDSPGHRVDIVGFRCVLEVRKPSPLFRPVFEAVDTGKAT